VWGKWWIEEGKLIQSRLLFSMGSGVAGFFNLACRMRCGGRSRFANQTKMRVFITFALFGFFTSHNSARSTGNIHASALPAPVHALTTV
jgi:hypothetical protein